jgi:hypothetical protein
MEQPLFIKLLTLPIDDRSKRICVRVASIPQSSRHRPPVIAVVLTVNVDRTVQAGGLFGFTVRKKKRPGGNVRLFVARLVGLSEYSGTCGSLPYPAKPVCNYALISRGEGLKVRLIACLLCLWSGSALRNSNIRADDKRLVNCSYIFSLVGKGVI